jgi:hypothetical protein
MPQRLGKHFVLPYEPEYAAHRRDDRVGRVIRLHLNLRESPSLAPEAPESGGQHGDKKKIGAG